MNDIPRNVSPAGNSYSVSIPTSMNPSYELRRGEDLGQSKTKGERNTKYSIRLIMVLTMVLVFIALASTALSVIAYRQVTAEHSQILSQLDQTNTMKVCTIPRNIVKMLSQMDIGTICRNEIQQHCGSGVWRKVAYLNMSDPSQQCPSAWREYNISGVRACGRPLGSSGCRITTYFFTGYQYRKICGRIIGYQVGTPDAFRISNRSITQFDGVRITYGAQRTHVWSFVAGHYDTRNSPSNCPCSSSLATMPPQFIGDNYYCESGNPSNVRSTSQFFSNDSLWDGQQCEGTCCTGTNSSLPWFSVQLPAPTADMIEVSICLDQTTDNEDIPVELIEMFVQ